MHTQPAQAAEKGSKSSWLAGTTSNTSLIGTQQECTHQLVHRDAAIAATRNIMQDTHLNIICPTGSSNNRKQHAVGCGYIHVVVNGCQLTVWYTVCACRQLNNQFISAGNWKPPWLTKGFSCSFRELQHQDVVSTGSFADKFPDKYPREWTKQG